MNIALILSGGVGSRMGLEKPKQYHELGGRPVLVRTMEQFQFCEKINGIVVVAASIWANQIWYWKELYGLTKLMKIAEPGSNRQQSILSGLLAAEGFMNHEQGNVVVQDAARPLTTTALIGQLLDGLREAPCVMPVLPMTDTVYKSYDGQWAAGLLERSTLFAGQAPEAFWYGAYLKLYKDTPAEKLNAMSGSSQLPQSIGWKVKLIPGERENIKLTEPIDWMLCETILRERDSKI